jgi:hypothetical protein
MDPIRLVCNGPLPAVAITHDEQGHYTDLTAFCKSRGPQCGCFPERFSFDAAIDYCMELCFCEEPSGRWWSNGQVLDSHLHIIQALHEGAHQGLRQGVAAGVRVAGTS